MPSSPPLQLLAHTERGVVKGYRWLKVLVVFPPVLAVLGLVWELTPYLVASVPMMVGVVALLLLTRRGAFRYERLLREGAPATVSITEVDEVAVSHLGHLLDLRLVVAEPGQVGKERAGQVRLSESHRDRVKPGAELSIRVDRAKPDVAAIAWTGPAGPRPVD